MRSKLKSPIREQVTLPIVHVCRLCETFPCLSYGHRECGNHMLGTLLVRQSSHQDIPRVSERGKLPTSTPVIGTPPWWCSRVPSRSSHPRRSQRTEHACTVGVATMSRLTSRRSVNAVRRWCLRRRCRRGGVGPRGVDDVSMCFRQHNSSAFSFSSTTNFSFVVMVFFFPSDAPGQTTLSCTFSQALARSTTKVTAPCPSPLSTLVLFHVQQGFPCRSTKRKPSLRCTQGWSTSTSTTRPSDGSAPGVAQTLPSPSEDFGGNGPSHLTTGPLFLQVVSFLRRASSSHPGAPCGSPPRSPIPPERRHQRGVEGQLGSLPQGQPVCDLNPSSIDAIESSQVEVAHEGVWGHLSSSLQAPLGCGTLKRNPPLSQNPCLGARCTMMSRNVELAATSACA